MVMETNALDTLAVKLIAWARTSLTSDERKELAGILAPSELCPRKCCQESLNTRCRDCWMQAMQPEVDQ